MVHASIEIIDTGFSFKTFTDSGLCMNETVAAVDEQFVYFFDSCSLLFGKKEWEFETQEDAELFALKKLKEIKDSL